MSALNYLWRVLAILLCVVFFSPAVRATPREDAERHFKAGLSLQKLDDFAAAIDQYEASLKLHPTRNALFNLSNCLRATHRYPEAFSALQRLLTEYDDTLDPAMAAASHRQLDELSRLTATLEVNVTFEGAAVDGASVSVDGRFYGTAPLAAPLRLKVGTHTIQVASREHEPVSETLELTPGASMIFAAKLKSLATPSAQRSPSAKPATAIVSPQRNRDAVIDSSDSVAPLGWWLSAGGAALLGGGAATGIWALSINSDLRESCSSRLCPRAQADDLARRDSLATATNVLLGLGAAVTATGVLVLLLDPDPKSDQLQLRLGPQFAGAQLRSRF